MLLIVRFDCFVAEVLTDSVDYQVRSYDVPATTDLESMLKEEPTHSYQNDRGEKVEWIYAELVAVEWEPNVAHGEEVIGFITGRSVRVKE